MHSRHFGFFLLLCLPLWGGCAAMGTLQTADTVGAGKTRWSTQLLAQRGFEDSNWLAMPLPLVAVGVQHGLTERVDVGARVSTVGLELSGKVELVESEASPWVVSLAPVVGGLQLVTQLDERAFDNLQVYAALPVVVGLDTAGGSQVVLGLRPTWLYFPESLRWPAENVFSMGGSLGYAFRVTPRLRLMPEVSVLVPVGPMPTDELRASGSRPHVQLGLAVMFDSAGDT